MNRDGSSSAGIRFHAIRDHRGPRGLWGLQGGAPQSLVKLPLGLCIVYVWYKFSDRVHRIKLIHNKLTS